VKVELELDETVTRENAEALDHVISLLRAAGYIVSRWEEKRDVVGATIKKEKE